MLFRSVSQSRYAGKFDGEYPDTVTEQSQVTKNGMATVKVDILDFNRYFNNGSEVITMLKAVNEWLASQRATYRYRFAYNEEVLAIFTSKPNLQQQLEIAAMGSMWCHTNADCPFTFFRKDENDRPVALPFIEDDFDTFWSFAVVREPIAA